MASNSLTYRDVFKFRTLLPSLPYAEIIGLCYNSSLISLFLLKNAKLNKNRKKIYWTGSLFLKPSSSPLILGSYEKLILLICVFIFPKVFGWVCQDGSEFMSTYCFCRRPEFSFQHPHCSSKPPVINIPGDSVSSSSSSLLRHHACVWCTYVHARRQADTWKHIK